MSEVIDREESDSGPWEDTASLSLAEITKDWIEVALTCTPEPGYKTETLISSVVNLEFENQHNYMITETSIEWENKSWGTCGEALHLICNNVEFSFSIYRDPVTETFWKIDIVPDDSTLRTRFMNIKKQGPVSLSMNNQNWSYQLFLYLWENIKFSLGDVPDGEIWIVERIVRNFNAYIKSEKNIEKLVK